MKYRRLVVGACAMCACAFGINAVLPGNTGKMLMITRLVK